MLVYSVTYISLHNKGVAAVAATPAQSGAQNAGGSASKSDWETSANGKMCIRDSYSPCCRKEVGAHGIEERGVYRIHQFEKQEMVVVLSLIHILPR